MKKAIIVPLLALVFAVSARAQEQANAPDLRKNIFKVNTFRMFTGNLQMNYERFFCKKHSLMLSNGITMKQDNRSKLLGITGELQYRNYLHMINMSSQGTTNPSVLGFYWGLYGLYSHLEYEHDYSIYDDSKNLLVTADVTAIDRFDVLAGGILGGMQLFMVNRATMDIYAGYGLRKTEKRTSGTSNYIRYNIFSPIYTGVTPKFGFQFGLMF